MMGIWRLLRHVLPILAIVGLAVAPVAVPNAAVAMTAASTAMITNMPCCPPEKPVVPDCSKACPLMTMCLAKYMRDDSGAVAVPLPLMISDRFAPSDVATRDGLSRAPPPRPPKA